MAFVVGEAGPHQPSGLEGGLKQLLEVVAALQHLHQIDAVGESPVGFPDRHPIGEGQIAHGGIGAQLPLCRPADVLHRTDPGFLQGRELPLAEPLPVKGGVVGQQRIGAGHHRFEAGEPLGPWLGQTAHRGGDVVDGLGWIVITGQQERHLHQRRAAGHVKQHGAHFDALPLIGGEGGGLGVENQQLCRASRRA